jgi:hypothetical protein
MTNELFKVGDVCKSRDGSTTGTVIGFMSDGRVVFESEFGAPTIRGADGNAGPEHSHGDMLPMLRTRIESRWVFLDQANGKWWANSHRQEEAAKTAAQHLKDLGRQVTSVQRVDFDVPV